MEVAVDIPLCSCHNTPMLWHKKPSGNTGGCWICRIKNRERVHAWRAKNMDKRRAHSRDWKSRNTDKRQEHARRSALKKFGLTLEEYDSMLANQGGVCAVCANECKTGRRLSVDHDHKTGRVRGLLCGRCNIGLGYFRDDPKRLTAAASYLEAHNG